MIAAEAVGFASHASRCHLSNSQLVTSSLRLAVIRLVLRHSMRVVKSNYNVCARFTCMHACSSSSSNSEHARNTIKEKRFTIPILDAATPSPPTLCLRDFLLFCVGERIYSTLCADIVGCDTEERCVVTSSHHALFNINA